jgi:hypothetical protein
MAKAGLDASMGGAGPLSGLLGGLASGLDANMGGGAGLGMLGGLGPLMGMFGGGGNKDDIKVTDTERDSKHFNPLMFLSPGLGLGLENPKALLSILSPGFGLANLFGAFKK